ncbi:acetylating acetaldehyde dehydrogenase [Teredinibacter purpureus]|uniref:acetylating acetaldehyde dehydrogenase n=1 Tax=Teredinibacter purpureus TaxID=2731756 RepID=UPI0006987871|nr:acetylating acetaldehyde dehydrogenase [Teredinibacter purpureus]
MAIPLKLRVGIIGSGKIGTDLLIKIQRSKQLQCDLFVGRNLDSPGIKKAQSLGVKVSDKSLQAFKDYEGKLDLVFDATSAAHHREHAIYFEREGIKAIDLTPAKVGRFCIPTIDADAVTHEPNINMVTCGGQASIPVINTLSKTYSDITKLEVRSHLAADSVGPGTLANIDEYYTSTASAISAYSCVQDVLVDLQLEKSKWKPDMLTCIRAYTDDSDLSKLYEPLQQRVAEVRKQVPGYNIVGTPTYKNGAIELLVSVRGQGDWIPAYAGNLDIINCAAIAIAENYATYMGIEPIQEHESTSEATHGALGAIWGMLGKGNKGMATTA